MLAACFIRRAEVKARLKRAAFTSNLQPPAWLRPATPGFQSGVVSEFVVEIRGSNDAPHDFGISRFGNVADAWLLRNERLARLDGERVF